MRILRLVAPLAIAYTPLVKAADIPSGPEPDTAIKPCAVAIVAGQGEGETLDIVLRRAERPTIYVFVQAERFDRPTARFIRAIDETLKGGVSQAPDAESVAVWLTDAPEKSHEFLPRAQQSLKLEKTTWSIYDGSSKGPDSWSINDAALLTAVVARDGKVVRSFGYQSLDEVEPREVLQALRSSTP
jgi:hypothetical protein